MNTWKAALVGWFKNRCTCGVGVRRSTPRRSRRIRAFPGESPRSVGPV